MQTFVGDTVHMRVNTGVDLTTLTTRYVKYRRPDGTTGKWNAVYVDDTIIVCHLSAGDLDMSGMWSVQAYASDGTETYHGDFVSFKVDDRIPLTTVPPTTLSPTTLP